jgi:hypothetical protein
MKGGRQFKEKQLLLSWNRCPPATHLDARLPAPARAHEEDAGEGRHGRVVQQRPLRIGGGVRSASASSNKIKRPSAPRGGSRRHHLGRRPRFLPQGLIVLAVVRLPARVVVAHGRKIRGRRGSRRGKGDSFLWFWAFLGGGSVPGSAPERRKQQPRLGGVPALVLASCDERERETSSGAASGREDESESRKNRQHHDDSLLVVVCRKQASTGRTVAREAEGRECECTSSCTLYARCCTV